MKVVAKTPDNSRLASARPGPVPRSIADIRSDEVSQLREQVKRLETMLESVLPLVSRVASLEAYIERAEFDASRQVAHFQQRKPCPSLASNPDCSQLTKLLHLLACDKQPEETVASRSGWSPRMSIPLSDPTKLPTAAVPDIKQTPLSVRTPSTTASTLSPSPFLCSPMSMHSSGGPAWPMSPSFFSKEPSTEAGSEDVSSRDSDSVDENKCTRGFDVESSVDLAFPCLANVPGSPSSSQTAPGSPSSQAAPSAEELKSRVDALNRGTGAWARAYRCASGARQTALYLLCMTGIVSTRELTNNSTSIGEDHIDDCVTVALEMIGSLPSEVWIRQPQEANKFFEGRFTSLYKQKHGDRRPS